MHHSIKTKKAFTLIEILVSLGITSIVMVIFFNILILTFKLTFISVGRSFVRENISNLSSLISTDVRNADAIISCREKICEIVIRNQSVTWKMCDGSGQSNRVCRTTKSAQGVETTTYKSPSEINIGTFVFEETAVSSEVTSKQGNVTITIVGSHNDPKVNVKNIINQVSVSTRNYEF